MNQRLIHPDLMTSLYRFFNSTCAIQSGTITAGDYGNSDVGAPWTSTSTDVDCVISRIKGGSEGNEIRRKDKTIVLHPYGIILDGVFTVVEYNRILSDSVAYDVLSVDYDSKSTMTSLVCELIVR